MPSRHCEFDPEVHGFAEFLLRDINVNWEEVNPNYTTRTQCLSHFHARVRLVDVIKAVRGTRDLFGPALAYKRWIEDAAGRILEAAGALEIETPLLEEAPVFERGVGEGTDIVQKEMYSFADRGGRRLVLRPEGTAGVMRAFLEHGMKVWPFPVKLFYRGPMFRAERPQKGRYRQFYQVGYEAVGLAEPAVDAEAIALLVDLLRELGLRDWTLKVSTVGDPEDRARYNTYLRETLTPFAEALSPESRERLRRNPLRILDSKDTSDQAVLERAGIRPLWDFLSDEARTHYQRVKHFLDELGIPYEEDPRLVRGLDYYVRTAFEVHHHRLGAQAALGGGGRYDGLTALLGGPSLPGVGWAVGTDRILLALEAEGIPAPKPRGLDLYLVPLDEEAVAEALAIAQQLRPDFRTELSYHPRRPIKGIREAERRGAWIVAFLGEGERDRGTISVKRLDTGEQTELPRQALKGWLEASKR